MLREMHLSRKESKREIQDVMEHSYRRRSLSGRRSNSDHKSGKETEYTSNPGKESNSGKHGPNASDKNAKISDKIPTMSDDNPTEVDLNNSKANTGYSTTPEHDLPFALSGKDGLVDRNTDNDKVTEHVIVSHTRDGESAADGKDSMTGTP